MWCGVRTLHTHPPPHSPLQWSLSTSTFLQHFGAEQASPAPHHSILITHYNFSHPSNYFDGMVPCTTFERLKRRARLLWPDGRNNTREGAPLSRKTYSAKNAEEVLFNRLWQEFMFQRYTQPKLPAALQKLLGGGEGSHTMSPKQGEFQYVK